MLEELSTENLRAIDGLMRDWVFKNRPEGNLTPEPMSRLEAVRASTIASLRAGLFTGLERKLPR